MLLPNEWIENSIETYIYRHTTKSQKIYWIVLIAIIAALVSLPFIYVDISIRGNGIIRPIAEKTEIKAPISELVDSIFVKEGSVVNKGDAILKFRTNNNDYKISYQSNRLDDYEMHLADLVYLAKGKKPEVFHSQVRRQQYSYYTKRISELNTALQQAEKDYVRNKILFDKEVISEVEFEKYHYQFEIQKNELASFTESQLSTWQTDLNSLMNSRNEMNASLKQEIKDKDLYIVKSPVSGTIDQFSGIYRGSSIHAGESLAVISPDSTLYMEVYIEPKKIGYLSLGMPVNIQVESFNYNEWGTIGGEITDISSDFLLDKEGNSFYKVKCHMHKDFLELKNGRRGELKKGMAVSAHFMVAKRSLFNLLYERMDDWVNPTQYAEERMMAKSQL